MKNAFYWLGALAALSSGCATTGGVIAPATPRSGLVFFLADLDAVPGDRTHRLVDSLNGALTARFARRSEARMSPISIADALAIVDECRTAPGESCWSALAEQNRAQSVAIPEVVRGTRTISISLTVFDGQAARVTARASRLFKDTDEPALEIAQLVDEIAR